MASFQSLHRGIVRLGGGTAAVAAASCFSSYAAERTGLEVGRQATRKTQQRLQHHLLAAAAARRPNLIIPYHNTHRFLSTSSLKKVGDAAAKTIQQAAASSKPASAVPPGRMTLVEWYEGHLDRNPLPTKMITGSLLWSLGDAVAQMVPPLAAGAPLPQYDVLRTGRACLFGFAIHAPTSHLHFNFLEYLTHRVGVKGLAIPVFKTIMEQFVYWSWVSNSMYHGAMGLMQGMSLSDIYQRLEDVLWDTQKAQWAFWIPVQLLNFQFIPVRHQLNVVLVTSVVWTALLSAWYPPVEEEEEGTVTKA